MASMSNRRSNVPEFQHQIHGVPSCLDKGILAAKSAKVAALLKQNPQHNLSCLIRDVPANFETWELVGRFCRGYELNLSTENVIPLTFLAYKLEMNESHSKNNLLERAFSFIGERVLPSWNETIKAFHIVSSNLQQAIEVGLFDACLESLINKALDNPQLLGEPIRRSAYDKDSEDEEQVYQPNARRKLFAFDWKQEEDVTTLPLQLYELLIHQMNQNGVPPQYVAASLCQYVTKQVFYSGYRDDNFSVFRRNSQREVIEAVERLLPHGKGIVPCTLLFKMLSVSSECSDDCRNGLEIRIATQLDEATVNDLLMISTGNAQESKYDIECLTRILKHFYGSYTSSSYTGIFSAAELMEEFLAEVASDIDLKTNEFISLAEMSQTVTLGTERNSDGIYRAIDIYLSSHRHLSEKERVEVCRVLDCQKMSPEACEHAAKNERLPVQLLVQVLLMTQLQIRDMFPKEFQDKLRSQEGEGNEIKKAGFDEEAMRNEMEKMSMKVTKLEKECHKMRKQIENGCSSSNHEHKKGKVSMWREMKRKLGCMSGSIAACNCQAKKKKVHPKY